MRAAPLLPIMTIPTPPPDEPQHEPPDEPTEEPSPDLPPDAPSDTPPDEPPPEFPVREEPEWRAPGTPDEYDAPMRMPSENPDVETEL
ncbi:MAG TPA: hypothetical protein VFM74_06645 [Candidatus Limnocylindria bacterium]|nr:hypothetical protein [Candidatus Limnocylindria bacterium]